MKKLGIVLAAVAGLLATVATVVLAVGPSAQAAPALTDITLQTGLTMPTAVRFTSDGQIYIAERAGIVKHYSSVSDTTPDVVLDIRSQVYGAFDRGLLGMELDKGFLSGRPYLYLLYAADTPNASTPTPYWKDGCPTPPGPSTNGCVVVGRLSRFTVTGGKAGGERILLTDWCQQFVSHSVGALGWAPSGALLASGGEGGSFTVTDWGQFGAPKKNPCGDPPGGVGGAMNPPSAEGGALRAQDVRTLGDPTGLSGSLIAIDPNTGAPWPTNPYAGNPAADANAKRIVAHGFRNPFRFTVRPGTNEIWLGDVGRNADEINRILPGATVPRNYGWPCFQGTVANNDYKTAGLTLCNQLYANPALVTLPYFTYAYRQAIIPNDGCDATGQSTSGLVFPTNPSYPARFQGALFMADYTRFCIYAMLPGANGLPDPTKYEKINTGKVFPVDLQVGPGGDVFYVDIVKGELHRLVSGGGTGAPVARIVADKTSGPLPLTVRFDGSSSTGTGLSYSWDLDGNGSFGDATGAIATRTYTAATTINVGLRVTAAGGATSTATIAVRPGAGPRPTLTTSTATWRVGQTISFSGSAVDGSGKTLPASALQWDVIMKHCPNAGACHEHFLRTWTGVTNGSFQAPDHEYPSHILLRLTATDSSRLSATAEKQLDPLTTTVTLKSNPSGLQVVFGSETVATPATRTVILGSANSVSAPTSETTAGVVYAFSSWSNGGARVQTVTVNGPLTLTANFSGAGGATTGVRFDSWFNRPGTTLASIARGTAPAWTGTLSGLSTATNRGDNLGTRLRAVVTAPVTGTYTFWIASDNDGVLKLSTNAEAAASRGIAQVVGSVGAGQYDVQATQKSGPIALVAGKKYFIEAWAKEGTGPDHLSVVWKTPTQPRGPIPQSALAPTTIGCTGWCP